MTNLFVAGTSYLLPSHKAWNQFTAYNKTEFYDYGDLLGAVENTPNDAALVLVLFFQDIYPVTAGSSDYAAAAVNSTLSLIKRRLSEARAETIICYADHDNDSPISHAKRDSDRHIAYQDFCSHISDMVSQSQSGYKVDLARALSKIGVDRTYDTRNWYLAHCHLSSDGIELLTNLIHQVSSRITRPPKKLLVLDCDNTLWGGVVGEDGVRGLKLGQDGLGQAFVDFQKAIKKVAQEGTLLAICSKNNENDVMSVFEEHHAMVLKKEDIVSWKVNWDQKSDNIRLIAQELDLGLESFVFWDDNPMERDLVRQNLPMVETPEAPKNVIEWPKLFQSMSHFAKFSSTAEDKSKLEQYRSRAKFVSELKSSDNRTDYLKSIGLKPLAQNISDSNIARAAQLCSKTNQFNLRTIRHTEADLEKLRDQEPTLNFLVSLTDNYGDHGIIGLVCADPFNKEYLFLDTFLMSCRVLGRNLESWMLHQLVEHAKIRGYRYLVGQHIPSERNQLVADLLAKHNFKDSPVHSSSMYALPLSVNTLGVAPLLFFDIVNDQIPNIEIFQAPNLN